MTADFPDVSIYRIPSASILRDEEIARFENEVFDLIRNKGALRLAIDFSNTYHVSSRALGLLVAFREEMKRRQGRIMLFGINPAIERVIELTRLNTLLPIHKDEQTAVAALRAAITAPDADSADSADSADPSSS